MRFEKVPIKVKMRRVAKSLAACLSKHVSRETIRRAIRKIAFTRLADERGSISVLIIGLFILTVALLMVMTDISSLILSRKALTQQTEYLVQQGANEIDLAAYYQGSGDLASYIAEKTFINQKDPGVPLDCAKSKASIFDAATTIAHDRLKNFELIAVNCGSGLLTIETQAEAVIPYRLPFLDTARLKISGFAANSPERRNGFWIRGLRIW